MTGNSDSDFEYKLENNNRNDSSFPTTSLHPAAISRTETSVNFPPENSLPPHESEGIQFTVDYVILIIIISEKLNFVTFQYAS